MKGETMRCPHCDCKISLRDVENEDGICPECGQPLLASNIMEDYDSDDDCDDDRGISGLEFDDEEEEDYEDESYSDEDDEQDEPFYEDSNDDDEGVEYAPHRHHGRKRRRSNDDF